ncbi:helix-turn-helix transcriptional regulator [Solwaraspora sp. WMMA2065]|uniref:helix-turn-helix domain-containing protein n=1 Tax=Solwaraspora sp. WMMA2065 TaxID=3015166 RepID=UPI00259B82FC|nr:helix-turn-helix transcriptional regulator [Solwaraspora sp. WMMA2065]WJK36233.1 helix-turn-helix transcriptional regulator [Solwaraspora sp. WMMA2065]
MSGDRRWAGLPETRRAAAAGDYGNLIRLARTAARLTLAEAGRRCGYSAASLSRIERGRQRLTDVSALRRLADVFDIPPELFGLTNSGTSASHHGSTSIVRLPGSRSWPQTGEDVIRRRAVLSGLAGLAGAAIPTGPGSAGHATARPPQLAAGLSGLLLGAEPSTTPPVGPVELRTTLAAASADLQACRYARLATRLPQLVTGAATVTANAADDRRCAATALATRAYHLTAQVLIKLHEDGMSWSIMDRAGQTARACGDPLLQAEHARITAIVLRRTLHRDTAQKVVLTGAATLDTATGLRQRDDVTAYGRLLATAAYTAALGDQRETALDLLAEADEATRRADLKAAFGSVDVALYRIGVCRALGDFGAAVECARTITPQQLGTVERRARYWQDTALALHGRGADTEAYRALLAAEQTAPQEVRYRPWAQRLTVDLLASDRHRSLPDLRAFATRIGADA